MKMIKQLIICITLLCLFSGCHSEIRKKVSYKPEVDRSTELYQKVVMFLIIKYKYPEWTTEEI